MLLSISRVSSRDNCERVKLVAGVAPAELARAPQLQGCAPWHGVELALSVSWGFVPAGTGRFHVPGSLQ